MGNNTVFDSNRGERGGIFYLTGRYCSFHAEYCVILNTKAIYGWLGYLDGDGTHLVNVGFTLSFNNVSENDEDEIDGIYISDGTDETSIVDITTFDGIREMDEKEVIM